MSRIGDQSIGQASRLPGWTVGHVLTHVARNADGHVRRLEGALRGEEVARYPGGPEQRTEGKLFCVVGLDPTRYYQ